MRFFALNGKSKLFIGVIVLLLLVLGLSYGAFTFVTQDYRASELLIAELNYGVNISSSDTLCTINGSKVTSPSNHKCFVEITVTSVNPIDSRYALAYKNNKGNPTVQYTDKSPWGSDGIIDGYEENLTYTRKVRVVIDNTGQNSEAETDFKVFGGYTFNTLASISLADGYKTIPGTYTESVEAGNNRLVDIVEKDTGCVTSSNKECLYGGGSVSNYLQYPTPTDKENKTDNLWRITGSYQVDGETLAKIVYNSDYKTNVSQENIKSTLDTFYNSLDKAIYTIENTKMFNCTSSGCTTSSYDKIGLLSTYEFDKIGGQNSYLHSEASWFALDNGTIKNITPSGIQEVSGSSGLRPAAYLQTDVIVTGKGTVDDPYRISPKGDINLVAYTEGGQPTTKTFQELLQQKVVSKVTCTGGTNAVWSYTDNSIKLTNVKVPDYCTIDFGEGYVVNVQVTGGSKNPNPKSVGYDGSVDFDIEADANHVLTGASVSCTQATGSIDNLGHLTVSNVRQAQTCTVTLKGKETKFIVKIKEDNPSRTTRDASSFSSSFTTPGLYVENDSKYFETDGKDPSINEVLYFAGPVQNNWVVFGGFWWRIIRTNEDGSVRLLYSGTATKGSDGKYTGHDQANAVMYASKAFATYNNPNDNTMYVGYMYGSTGSLANNRLNTNSSTIKTKVDEWYDTNMTKKDEQQHTYGSYLSRTAIYCNDRATLNYLTTSTMYYAAYYRLVDNKRPSFKCGNNENGSLYAGTNGANVADKFTGKNNSGVGNQKLADKPIALMTADEVVYAGGVNKDKNVNAWYYQNSVGGSITGGTYWFTMSPYYAFSGVYAKTFIVGAPAISPGYLSGDDYINDFYGVRPVVSIKACATVTGSGTTDDPYIPATISADCAAADN